ncbi:MAG TPA: helix-turn-helix transcriptional regulator [Alphaproteobacteria bacterium]|nr:helix-turn-helix transcriptional regulator [Alphaproteobacteria bacterium]
MRAARAMLDVPQGYVAEHLGIAANTLSKIESGQSDVSMSRMAEIQRFYEREGIEFLSNDGVAWKSGGVDTYRGRSGFLEFIMDVYETVKGGGSIFVNNVDEDDFLKWEGDEADAHMARMASIKGLQFKILVKEGDTNTISSGYAKYKALSKENFGEVPLYIYGDKTALIVFEEENVEVFVIKHFAITQYFIDRFNKAWAEAKEIS